MKSKIKSAILLFSGVVMLATPAMAVTTTNGDLLLGFYQVIGGNIQANTYIFDLGAASLYRESALNNVSVSTVNTGLASNNIGADLVASFGSNWANDGSVFWTVFGGTQLTNPIVITNGDPSASSYISKPVSTYSLGDKTTTPDGISGGPRTTLANGITVVRSAANGTGTNVGNAAGTRIPIAGASTGSIDEFMPPTTNYSLPWAVTGEKRGLFGTGTIAGSNGLEGALDVYRYVNATSGTGYDPTAARSAGNAALGAGQYIGTFTIDGLGNLGVGEISAVPEPSGALALGLIGTLAGLGYRSRRSVKLA